MGSRSAGCGIHQQEQHAESSQISAALANRQGSPADAMTNKYNSHELGPVDITGSPSIEDSACDRGRAELFALKAVELMERLPPCLSGRVALLYEGGERSQAVAVDAQFTVRITQYINSHYPDIEIDARQLMEIRQIAWKYHAIPDISTRCQRRYCFSAETICLVVCTELCSQSMLKVNEPSEHLAAAIVSRAEVNCMVTCMPKSNLH